LHEFVAAGTFARILGAVCKAWNVQTKEHILRLVQVLEHASGLLGVVVFVWVPNASEAFEISVNLLLSCIFIDLK
jgi:hypothetical protein